MSLRHWIRTKRKLISLLDGKVKSDRTGGSRIYFLGDRGIPHPDDTSAFIKAKEVDPFVGIAVEKIASAISSLPLDIMRRDIVDGKVELTDDNDHPANELIEVPNSQNTPEEFKIYMTQAHILAGEFFVSLEAIKNGAPSEMYFLEPDKMSVKGDKKTGLVSEFIYQENKGEHKHTYKPEEIIHGRNYDLTNRFYGRSKLLPIQKMILLNYYATQTNISLFQSGAIPAAIFLTDQALTPEQEEQFIKTWYAKHKGPEKRGRIGILPAEIKDFKQVQTDFKDMLYNEQTRLIREIIFAMLGLPPFVGGVMEYANYANALPQEQSFWRNTIMPLCRTIEGTLTRQLLWRHYDPSNTRGHIFKFNLTQVPALQDNLKEKADAYSILTRARIFTSNEARAEGFNKEPTEGGDEFYQPPNPFRVTDGNPEEEPKEEEEKPEGSDDKSIGVRVLPRDRSVLPSAKDMRNEHWKANDARLEKQEKGFKVIIYRYLKEQENRIITGLYQFTNEGKLITPLRVFTKNDIPPDDINIVFDLTAENLALGEVASPYMRDALRRSAEMAISDFGLDLVFNVHNPEVIVALERFKSRLIKVNDVNYDVIKDILREGYDAQQSIGQISEAIRKEYTHWREYRPMRVARTEMLGVTNNGSLLAYQQSAVGQKEWLASPGARDSHAMVHGQVVAVNEAFTRGLAVPMMYPGDPSGPAEEIVNCRCTMMPVIDSGGTEGRS